MQNHAQSKVTLRTLDLRLDVGLCNQKQALGQGSKVGPIGDLLLDLTGEPAGFERAVCGRQVLAVVGGKFGHVTPPMERDWFELLTMIVLPEFRQR